MRQAVAEDAVQEAGARAIAHDVPFVDADDLLRWIQTVAWRVVLDAQTRARRLVYEVPDSLSGEDVGRAVEDRIRLQRLRVLLGALTPEEHATLTEDGRTADRRTSVRLAVRRHRLRIKLLAMLDGAAVVLVFLRRLGRVERSRRSVMVAAPALAAATVLMTASLMFDHGAAIPAIEPVDTPASLSRREVTPVADAAQGRGVTAGVRGSVPHPGAAPADLVVRHPGPGGDGDATVRPKEPTDHFVCVDMHALPANCADLPIRITE